MKKSLFSTAGMGVVLILGIALGALLYARGQEASQPRPKTQMELQAQIVALLEEVKQLSSTPSDSKALELEIGTFDTDRVPQDDYFQRVVEAPRPFLCLMAPRLKNPANAEEVVIIGYVALEHLPAGTRMLYLQPKTLRYRKPPR